MLHTPRLRSIRLGMIDSWETRASEINCLCYSLTASENIYTCYSLTASESIYTWESIYTCYSLGEAEFFITPV